MSDDWTSRGALLWKLIGDLLRAYVGRREKFFGDHVEPLQERLAAIHKDYVSGFEELRRHLANASTPPLTVVEFLRERRRDLACERALARCVARELRKVRKLAIGADERKTLDSYCRGIVNYFHTGSDIGGMSWYSHFLEFLQQFIEEGRDDVWTPMPVHGDSRAYFLEEIDLLLDKRLPRAFERVAKNYARIRTELL